MDFKFSTQDVANIIHVSKPTIINWIKEGKIACSEKDEKNNRYSFSLENVNDIVKKIGKKEPRIITFANIKGGVGKTFISVNFASVLNDFGFKVLVVDTDKQANMSEFFLEEIPNPNQATIYNVFTEDDPGTAIRRTKFEGIEIVPSNPKFGEIVRKTDIETYIRLKKFLEKVKSEYDFIVIDTPPDIGTPVEGALVATEYLFVVLDADKWAIHGIEYLFKLVRSVNSAYNMDLKINGCIANKIDERRVIDKELLMMISESQQQRSITLLKPSIPQSTKYRESLLMGEPITKAVSKEDHKRLVYPVIELTLGVFGELK